MRIYQWLNVEPVPVASDSERDDWARYLETDKDAAIDRVEVTELLLREVKYLIDTKIDLIKGTDGKAAMQITVLGGGLGIISILGATQSVIVVAGNLWLLGLAALLIAVGAALDFACLARGYRYTSQMPRVDVYNSPAVLNDRRMEARVSSSIIEGYLSFSNDLTALNARKSRLLKVATVALILGVLSLVTNAGWAVTHPIRTAPTNCHFSTTSIECKIEH